MNDPLAHLKQGVNIDKQKSHDDIAKDKEYEEPLKKPLEEQKEDILESLYGKQKPIEDIEKEQGLIEEERKIDEHPQTPLIDGFVSQGLLNSKEGELVKEALILEGEVLNNINNLKNIAPEKKLEIIHAIEFLDKEESKTYLQQKFNNDFKEKITELKQPVEGGKKGEKELQGKNKDLVDMLGSNYINLISGEGKQENKQQALNRAFKTTVNKIIYGKSFKRPDAFNNMLDVINDSEASFKDRFEELKKVYTLVNDHQSRANSRTAKAFQNSEALAEKQEIEIKTRFNEFKEQVKIVKETGNKEKAKDLLIEANKLIDEADQGGDVFNIIGDIDILMHDLQDIIEYT